MGKAAPLPEKKGTMCDALGSCLHWTRIGMHSYQHPSVAYGSGRKNPKSAQNDPRETPPRAEWAEWAGGG